MVALGSGSIERVDAYQRDIRIKVATERDGSPRGCCRRQDRSCGEPLRGRTRRRRSSLRLDARGRSQLETPRPNHPQEPPYRCRGTNPPPTPIHSPPNHTHPARCCRMPSNTPATFDSPRSRCRRNPWLPVRTRPPRCPRGTPGQAPHFAPRTPTLPQTGVVPRPNGKSLAPGPSRRNLPGDHPDLDSPSCTFVRSAPLNMRRPRHRLCTERPSPPSSLSQRAPPGHDAPVSHRRCRSSPS